MLRSRAVPIAAAIGVGAFTWSQTAGGRNQPVGHAERGDKPLSESLQAYAGTGGQRARAQGELESDPKDTRMASAQPDAPSKRSATKTLD
ncbi:hypothetical protein QBC39DRAFT_47953 [Podospora conica]|nr:hypothetical protein QBC39DRAFT_47953 [Schizothecium conicum]